MNVGDPIWYSDDLRGVWTELRVVGETRFSWVVDAVDPALRFRWTEKKIKKQGFLGGKAPPSWALSLEHIRQLDWVKTSRFRIGERVGRCTDYAALQAIEKLLNEADARR